jgi:hypothetical protein
MKFAFGVVAYLTVVSSVVGLGALALVPSLDRPASAGPVSFTEPSPKVAVVAAPELPPIMQMKPEPVAEHRPMVIHGEAARLRAEARKAGPQPGASASDRRAQPRSRQATQEARDAFASSSERPLEAPRPFVKEHRVH